MVLRAADRLWRRVATVPETAVVTVVTLLAALWASWPAPAARYAAFATIGFYAVINAVTVRFFAPAVLQSRRTALPPTIQPPSGGYA